MRTRRGKFNAQPTVVDGIRFASKKEARRYGELKLLEKAGQIYGLQVQPRYPLYVDDCATGTDTHVGDYVGDFAYTESDGGKVLEDVKGVKTAVYKLKKKIVEALYGIIIREI